MTTPDPADEPISHRVWVLHGVDSGKWWLAAVVEYALAPRPKWHRWTDGAQEWGDPVDRERYGGFSRLLSFEETYATEALALTAFQAQLTRLLLEARTRYDNVSQRLGVLQSASTEDEAP